MLTKFVEQPCIFDGNDSLGSKARDQSDLLISEGTNFLAGQYERTNHFALFQQWDSQSRPYAPNFDGCDSRWIAFNVGFLCRNVGGMNRSFGSQHATDRVSRTYRRR